MNRREWLTVSAVAGIATAFPNAGSDILAEPDVSSAANAQSSVNVELKRLNLQHTWTTAMSSSTYRETVNVRYTRSGITGYGEGAPIIRYKE